MVTGLSVVNPFKIRKQTLESSSASVQEDK
jgi:hypothetical protein